MISFENIFIKIKMCVGNSHGFAKLSQVIVNYVFVFNLCMCVWRDKNKSTHFPAHNPFMLEFWTQKVKENERTLFIFSSFVWWIRCTAIRIHSTQVPQSNLHFNVGPFSNSSTKEKLTFTSSSSPPLCYKATLVRMSANEWVYHEAQKSRTQIKRRMHEILKSERHAI